MRKVEVSLNLFNRARVLAQNIIEMGMQTETTELDLTTAEFGELWQIARKVRDEIEEIKRRPGGGA